MTFAGTFHGPVARAHQGLRLAAGVVLTGLLVFAPLNFGSTRAGGPEVLTAGCTVATLLWAASLVCRGPRPQVPVGAAACIVLLTLAAFPWIAGLAPLTSVSAFTQNHFADVVARWPSSIVWRTPANALASTLALAAAALPLIDLARTRGWALTFSLALTLTAVAIGLLALLQNYTHATGIYWRNDGRMPGNFCGTFYHHTAAGAYFNTAWPLAVALTWLAWLRSRSASGFPFLLLTGVAGTILLLAAHGSHVSRFPQVAALAVAPFLLCSLPSRGRLRWYYGVPGLAAVVLLVAIAGRPAEIRARWGLMFADAPVAARAVQPPESEWPALMRTNSVEGVEGPGDVK